MEFTTHLELHSQTTRLFEGTLHSIGHPIARDSHPLWRPVPRNIDKGQHQRYLLQITTRTPKTPDFKFELLPLHSPLLRQSLLVSFPPLIDMLKFSGYSYLIWGQTYKKLLGRANNTRNLPPGFRSTSWINLIHWINQGALSSTLMPIFFKQTLSFLSVSLNTKPKGLREKWRSNRHALWNTKERNVRSKIRWFTKICNSYYLSHFAAFFIDARTKRSTVESFKFFWI